MGRVCLVQSWLCDSSHFLPGADGDDFLDIIVELARHGRQGAEAGHDLSCVVLRPVDLVRLVQEPVRNILVVPRPAFSRSFSRSGRAALRFASRKATSGRGSMFSSAVRGRRMFLPSFGR